MATAALAPLVDDAPHPSGEDRYAIEFWESVARAGQDECWEWTGGRTGGGYGVYRREYTHRVSFRLSTGSDPGSLHVLHSCDNPPCVNPAHLFLGTQAANVADMIAKGRLVLPPHGARGESHHRSKLNVEQVRKIRSELAAGATQRNIAAIYGLSQSSVWAIANRKSWKSA